MPRCRAGTRLSPPLPVSHQSPICNFLLRGELLLEPAPVDGGEGPPGGGQPLSLLAVGAEHQLGSLTPSYTQMLWIGVRRKAAYLPGC